VFRVVVTKLGELQMVNPILLIRRHIIPQELLDHQVDPFGLSIDLGVEGSAHLEF
jgi:hypothetical protein